MDTITSKELEALTGLTDRRHRQLAKDGFFPEPSRGEYKFTPTLRGLFKYYQEQQHAGRNLKDQKTRKEIENLELERKARERNLQILESKVIDAEIVWDAWEKILVTFRNRVVSMPSKLQSSLGLSTKQAEIVRLEVSDALEELSKSHQYDTTEKANKASAESDSPDAASTD